MENLTMMTKDLTQENIKKIQALFPNAVTEIKKDGKVQLAIDFDVLKKELSNDIMDEKQERYQMTWPDKSKAIRLANTPITATLRPCKEESVDFDTTQNLYIEGDNLDVLKLLRETYLGKVKMIYIDPPYNTGNDFVYEDDFAESASEYAGKSGQYDDQGNRLVQNTESNGRFHTDWLNMIYPRLKVARDLLTDDGVIFISIDDNEVENLKKVCNEVFGEKCFVGCFLWRKKSTSTNVANAQVSSQVDYQLCYSRTDFLCLNRRMVTTEDRQYSFEDERGKYRTTIIEKKDSGSYARETMKFPICGIYPRSGKRWQIGEQTARTYEKDDLFIVDEGIIKLKIYEKNDKNTFSANPNLLLDFGSTDSANKESNISIFNQPEVFSNPKPIRLVKHFIDIGTMSDSIILDFFSGSATTAHAVMQLNAEDGGNRKFIMVQLPEVCDEKSEAYKAGYKNICEIGKERIRRAGKKIKDSLLEDGQEQRELAKSKKDNPNDLFHISEPHWIDSEEYKNENKKLADALDIGFRVLKLDSSNMKDVFYTPAETQQGTLFDLLEDNIKEGRSPMDLLFQVMLEKGIMLSAKIEEKVIAGKTVFIVNSNELIACFDSEINNEVITAIAQMSPLYAAFRNSCFESDSARINCEQLFKTYSPSTTIKVI